MRSFLVTLALVLSAATAHPYQYQVRNAPQVPPATANDLLKAQRLAERARARLERPRARTTSGWLHGEAR